MKVRRTSRTLGLLGGMSWESTALYYRALNQGVAARRGGLASARLVLASLDFAEIAALQSAGDWDGCARVLGGAGAGLRAAGAQALLIATNTMHKVADKVERASGLPLLHIVDATGAALRAAGVRRAALLGTRFTMEDPDIVTDRLQARFGVESVVPDAAGRAEVHRIIYDELCRGRVEPRSSAALAAQIEALARRGAEAVILGCTELTLAVAPSSSPLPVFDTTALHAAAGVEWLLDDDPAPLQSEGPAP